MLAIITVGLALAACAAAGTRQGGYATYDALREATAACAAKGGKLELVRNGDAQYLEDYACKRK